MSQVLVLDASVAAKWYLDDEPLSELAVKFLKSFLAGEIEFHAPELLKYEMAEAMHKAQRPLLEIVGQCRECGAPLRKEPRPARSRLDRSACEKSYRAFCELGIKYYRLSDEERVQVLELSNQHGKHFYDTCYVWLAQKLNCPLLTNDAGSVRKLPLALQLRALMLDSFL